MTGNLSARAPRIAELQRALDESMDALAAAVLTRDKLQRKLAEVRLRTAYNELRAYETLMNAKRLIST